MHPLISLICPVYNCENFLSRCIESVVAQTYTNWELILIDDGSKDNSLKICYEYAQSHAKIQVLSQTHKGVSAARNYGMSKVKGDYILFIDADDFVESEHVQNLHDNAQKYDADICIASMHVFDVELGQNITNKYFNKAKTIGILDKRQAFKNIIYRRGFGGEIAAKMFKTSLIQGLKFDETEIIGEDFSFNCQALHIANKIVFINDLSYHYIRHSNSATRYQTPQNLDKKIKSVEKLEVFIRTHYPDLSSAKDVFYLYTLFSILHLYMKLPERHHQKERQYQKILRHKLKNTIFNPNMPLLLKLQISLLGISLKGYRFIRYIYIYIYARRGKKSFRFQGSLLKLYQ